MRSLCYFVVLGILIHKSNSQSRSLPTRLLPPPKNVRFESSRTSTSKLEVITLLPPHTNAGKTTLAQLLSGRSPNVNNRPKKSLFAKPNEHLSENINQLQQTMSFSSPKLNSLQTNVKDLTTLLQNHVVPRTLSFTKHPIASQPTRFPSLFRLLDDELTQPSQIAEEINASAKINFLEDFIPSQIYSLSTISEPNGQENSTKISSTTSSPIKEFGFSPTNVFDFKGHLNYTTWTSAVLNHVSTPDNKPSNFSKYSGNKHLYNDLHNPHVKSRSNIIFPDSSENDSRWQQEAAGGSINSNWQQEAAGGSTDSKWQQEAAGGSIDSKWQQEAAGGSTDSKWQPKYQSFVLQTVEEKNSLSSFNTFIRSFATARPAPNISVPIADSRNHLFFRTEQYINDKNIFPGLNKKIQLPLNKVLPKVQAANKTDIFNNTWKNISLAQFYSIFNRIEPTFSNNNEAEEIIHLNSTSRNKKLAQFLNEYLKNPVHHSSNGFETEIDSFLDQNSSLNDKNGLNKNKNTISIGNNKFHNGFHAQINTNTSGKQFNQFEMNIGLVEKETDVQFLTGIKFSNTSNKAERTFDIPFIDNFAENHIRPTPTPVKIIPVAESNIFNSYYIDSDLLLQSPSVSSYLTIAKAGAANKVSHSLRDLFGSASSEPSSILKEDMGTTKNLRVFAKVSQCPTLYTDLLLECEVVSTVQEIVSQLKIFHDQYKLICACEKTLLYIYIIFKKSKEIIFFSVTLHKLTIIICVISEWFKQLYF